MNFVIVCGASLCSGYAPRCATPQTAAHDTNRQKFHLSKAETCPDKAGHLCRVPVLPAHRCALRAPPLRPSIASALYMEAGTFGSTTPLQWSRSPAFQAFAMGEGSAARTRLGHSLLM